MSRRPSRLYRLTPELPKPLLRVRHSEGLDVTDDAIGSVSITHGSTSGVATGLTPAQLGVEVTGYRSTSLGATLTADLTDAAASAIGSLCGVGPQFIKARFRGRVGRQSVEDNSSAARRVSTIDAVSWSRQLGNAEQTAPASYNRNVGVFLQDVMTPGWGGFDSVTRADSLENYGEINEAMGEMTYSDAEGQFLPDYGLWARDRRGGGIDLLTRSWRRSTALANYSGLMPLTRSMALAPATWEQSIEDTPINYYFIWTNADGTTGAGNYGDLEDPSRRTVEVDLSHIRIYGPHLDTYGQSLKAAQWTGAYEVPSLTVDLLMLMRSPFEAHRKQAGQILALQPGDPVTFSGDWPELLRGIYFAEGISESITPDQWQITLSLVPFQNVTGELSPTVRPRTWESATDRWSEATYSWASIA